MGTANHTLVHRIPARVFVNPTNLSAGAPFGGTEIGAIWGIGWTPGDTYSEIVASELGSVLDWFRTERPFKLGMRLRQYDAGALASIFRTSGAGISSGDPTATISSATGVVGSSARRKILVAPGIPGEDTRTDQPGLLVYSALGIPAPDEDVRMSILYEAVFPALFLALPDSSGRIAFWGKLEDMTL